MKKMAIVAIVIFTITIQFLTGLEHHRVRASEICKCEDIPNTFIQGIDEKKVNPLNHEI